mgnify:CR=1 FL=1
MTSFILASVQNLIKCILVDLITGGTLQDFTKALVQNDVCQFSKHVNLDILNRNTWSRLILTSQNCFLSLIALDLDNDVSKAVLNAIPIIPRGNWAILSA